MNTTRWRDSKVIGSAPEDDYGHKPQRFCIAIFLYRPQHIVFYRENKTTKLELKKMYAEFAVRFLLNLIFYASFIS
jgi:hypothetical protein